MSIPDPRSTPDAAAAPGELTPLERELPRAGETPRGPAIASSTPGVALAGARFPGQPSLPDVDPVSLTRLVSDLANQLFATPPAPVDVAGAPLDPSPEVTPGALPLGGAPSLPDAPTRTGAPIDALAGTHPVAGTHALDGTHPVDGTHALAGTHPATAPEIAAVGPSPFSAPLDFDAIAMPHGSLGAPSASPDAIEGLSLSLLDPRAPMPEVGAPATPGPTAPPGPAVVTSNAPLSIDAFEIVPAADPAIAALGSGSREPFDPEILGREFPILRERVHGRRLVWLDNAATTQKPRAVIDRLSHFYEHENSNIHRAAHTLAARATDAYETARESVRRFVNAGSVREVVFVRGTTEGINLVAQSWGRRNVGPGDEIVVSWLEHHANIVPWQMLCSEKGAKLKVAPVDDTGQVLLDEYEKLLGPRTKLVSFTQVSNALGTITPAREMIEMAHRHGAVVLLDGAQAVSHMPVDVQALDCDFFVFSGHKVFGPTGIGAVVGRRGILDATPPWQGGGNMIEDVTFERTRYQAAPARFEAGTGNIADAVGLGAALDWVSRVGIERIERYEHELLEYGTRALATVPGLTMIGTAAHKAGVLSFILAGQKTEEVGGMLDREGIAVRSGHHCAQPILRRFGLEATVRASLAPYNTKADLDALVDALCRIQSGHVRAR
jgi:cysteine desulfurase/selenocysteine lyase